MSRKADRDGLSLGYRIAYRVKVIGMHLYGPAQLGDAEDPHRRLERQRAAKVAAAKAASANPAAAKAASDPAARHTSQ